MSLLSFPLTGNTIEILNQFLRIGRCDYFGDYLYSNERFSETDALSVSFQRAGYLSTTFLRLFGSIWVYFVIVCLHGLLVVALNVTKLRNRVKENLDEDLMGWLLKISQASYWFDTLIILMAESFLELLLCAVLGFFSVKHLPAITLTTFDYVS